MNRSIESTVRTSHPAEIIQKLNSLEKVHDILQKAAFVVPDDADLECLKQERIEHTYGVLAPNPIGSSENFSVNALIEFLARVKAP